MTSRVSSIGYDSVDDLCPSAQEESGLPLFTPTWMTGTSSSTLAMMLATHRSGIFTWPALMPGATLLAHKIAPLAGEIGTCNCISGVPPDPDCIGIVWSYANRRLKAPNRDKLLARAFLFPAQRSPEICIGPYLESIELNVLRLLQMGFLNDAPERARLKEHLEKVLQIFQSAESIQEYLWPKIGYCFSGLDEFQNKYNEEFREWSVEKIERILSFFEEVKPISFSAEEIDLIQRPCPVVFASNTIQVEHYGGGRYGKLGGRYGELVVKTEALLERDLQVIYTNEIDVERIKRVVKDFKVYVSLAGF